MKAESNRRVAAVLCGLWSLSPLMFALTARARVLTLVGAAFAGSFCLAVAAAWLLGAIRRPWLRRVVAAVLLLPSVAWAIFEVGTLATTGQTVNIDSLTLVSETTLRESREFMVQYLSRKVIGYFALAAVVTAAIAATSRLAMRSRLLTAVIFAAGCFMIGRYARALTFPTYEKLIDWRSYAGNHVFNNRKLMILNSTAPLKAACLGRECFLLNRHWGRWEALQQRVLAAGHAAVRADSRPVNVVLIIGESFIRRHSSLYGYALETNPRLGREAAQGRLTVFDSVFSTSNFTTPALRNIFNLNSTAQGQEWYDGVYFPMLMKQAGFRCVHFDNQTPASTGVDPGIGKMFYSTLNREYTYDALGDSTFQFDGDFLSYANRHIDPTAGNTFATYHLYGQHFPARTRYPAPGRFTAADILALNPGLSAADAAGVAAYDNATLYNDSVVDAIFRFWAETPTVAIYLSDHGEDIADLGAVGARNVQRPDDPEWVDRQFHVPFFIWTSPAYRALYPERVDQIRAAAPRRTSTDLLGHLILNQLGIRN